MGYFGSQIHSAVHVVVSEISKRGEIQTGYKVGYKLAGEELYWIEK
jgi:hypothetical protein